MNSQHITETGNPAKPSALARARKCFPARINPALFLGMALLPLVLLAASSASADPSIRFQFTGLRATIPVGTTNVSLLGGPNSTNNTVILSGVTNVNFSVSGLPTGASAVLVDGNTNALPSTTDSTNLMVMLNTTNVAQGVYLFTLNCDGLDTNGLPVTNSFPFVLQAAHIWNGSGLGSASFGLSNNWATAANWLGGAPGAADDVVIGDAGGQTNAPYAAGISNNIGIDTSVTVASIRFAQTVYTNAVTTNSLFHSIRIGTGATLSVIGTNGFSLLRDYIGEFGLDPDRTMGINFSGSNGIGGTLMVSNAAANFGILVGNGLTPSLSLSNLSTFVTYVSRFGVSDYQLYPNYRALNNGYNAGRDLTSYSGRPRQFLANYYMARTNYVTAIYVDPNNYTNESTRSYAVSLDNNEQSGNNTASFFYLGLTNVFRADSVCFVGANSQSVGGGVKFGFGRFSSAIFRSTNGGRMSVFTISDGGGTNQANSNMKATIDFSGATNYVDILADRLYIARDRVMIASNQTPNVQGDLTIGYGNVDVNTAVLGYQEHSNKVDWTSLYGAQPYLNYCEGRLVLTNGGGPGTLPCTFKVNGNLTLGYTADMNPPGSAQQYNTYGQVTILSNATLIASNIICDGGLNYFDNQGRRNTITINRGGNLIVTNVIGFNSSGANNFSAASPNGMRLDTLTMTASTLTLFVNPSKTNVFVRTLTTLGTIPSVIKVAALTGVSSYPAQIPVISYQGVSSPFLTADVSSLGAGYFGFILNNFPNHTIDIYITTNAPNNLIWTGIHSGDWDTTTLNWVTTNGVQTNFNLGDLVTFNDSATVTNVNIVGSVIPGQTGVGVTISNSASQYTFSGGTVAGTALVVKQGTNFMIFNSSEQGPIQILAGSLFGNGNLGSVIVASNVVLNFAGNINGGLVSTGNVFFAGGTLNGPISLQGGTFFNLGTVYTGPGGLVTMAPGTTLTNTIFGTMNLGIVQGGSAAGVSGATWLVPAGSTLANFGTINLYQPRIQVEGLLYGYGTINDPNGGGYDTGSSPTRLVIQNGGLISPGVTPEGSISNMTLFCRFDFNNQPDAVATGIGTVRIEVDFNNPQTNDILYVDRWNNDTGPILMTNINPGAGSFASHAGQVFTVFNNNGVNPTNFIDTAGFCPTIIPYVPGPGLVWGVSNFNLFGSISVTNCSMVWDGVGNANWSTNASDTSWKTTQPFFNNRGALFDDSANGSTTVTLTGLVAPEGTPSTTVTNIVGVTTNVLVIPNQPVIYPGLIVSNATKDYVFVGGVGAKITGMTGIYKTGPGTLTLMTSNDFSGNVIVDNGTLAITNYPGAGIISLGVVQYGQMRGHIILDGGTLSYVGTTNAQLGTRWVVISPKGATINVASSSNIFNINQGIANDGAVGSGGLTKTGPGVLQLSSASGSYSGVTIINQGTLRLLTTAASTNTIILANNTTLELTNGVGGNAVGMTLTNGINVTGSGTTISILGMSTNVFLGPWTGGGSVTIAATNPADLSVFNGDLSGFNGTVSFGASSNLFRFNNNTNGNPCTGSATATFDLGTGSATLGNLNGSNLVYNLGALSGGPNTVLTGRASTNSASTSGTTYSIGANGSSTTFSGQINNGLGYNGVGVDTVSVVKVGSGRLLLNGVSTYTGSTTVSNGVLGGTGSIAGSLTNLAGGTLSPGASTGTFTIGGNAMLGGTVLMELNEASSPVNDMLAVNGTITATGVLVVTNIGPDLYNHSTFKLFSKPVTGFSSVTLPAKDPSNTKTYVWINNLSVDGTIQLVSGGTINTNPGSISTSVSGSTLNLSWAADRIGWRLQVQTNPLAVGLRSNWFTVDGSTNVNNVPIPLDVNNGSVFYRLIYP